MNLECYCCIDSGIFDRRSHESQAVLLRIER